MPTVMRFSAGVKYCPVVPGSLYFTKTAATATDRRCICEAPSAARTELEKNECNKCLF